jgi:hypothetical protein
VIEAIGRCVVWIDEIEKALQGATSGSPTAACRPTRWAVLSWMQERPGEAFVIATANDVETCRRSCSARAASTKCGGSICRRATEGGGVRAVWETEKTIADAVEYEAATKVKSKVRALITGACIYSAHGLLCPEDGIENLEKAMREARQHVKEFNAKAKLTRVSFYSISGRIAADDVEAVKAINAELEGLLARMAQGVEQLDVKAIREAASKAKEVGGMLKPELQARIQIAVDVARSAAKQIVKAGETAALEIDRAAIRKIEESRTAFLDLDEAAEVKAPEATGGRSTCCLTTSMTPSGSTSPASARRLRRPSIWIDEDEARGREAPCFYTGKFTYH